MKYDVVIIGGGLSSLVCGIKLQKAGKNCLIVSAGQNALHFSSGTLGLLSRMPDGTSVSNPLEAIPSLGPEHPYSKIGVEKIKEYCSVIKETISNCGIELQGDGQSNGWTLTASGVAKPAWLAMKDVTYFQDKNEKFGDKALIVNFAGYLDFNSMFIANALEKRGMTCRLETLKIDQIEALRKNPSEMRSVNIARVMSKEENWKQFAYLVQEHVKDEDVVIMPSVFGLVDPIVNDWLREMIPAKLMFVGTMPPSVPGIHAQMQLKKTFEKSGGTFLMGDEVNRPSFSNEGKVLNIHTSNLGNFAIEADNFVLASGNIFGKGLLATPTSVNEPVFGLDVEFPSAREDWYDKSFFEKQNFTGFGVRTDKSFRAFKNGNVVGNLFVIGAELGGHNPLYEGSGSGVAILSAMAVADQILD